MASGVITMRAAGILVAIFLAGCATQREVEQYNSDVKSWQTGNQQSRDAWSESTGGSFGGGGIGPAPKDPRGTIHFN
jgi:outer membrane biogenesis lipoprotein LolB